MWECALWPGVVPIPSKPLSWQVISVTHLRAEVARRAGERCEYCLIHELEAGFPHQVDHIVSRKHGGESTSDNLAYACVDLQSVLRQ